MIRLDFLRACILDRPGLVHGFTTRHGGVSQGPYESLNLSFSRGDERAAVLENRTRVAKALGLQGLAFAEQRHGRRVVTVNGVPAIGSVREGDALITDRPGVGLVAQAADCTPVLLFDPERPAVAAVHSGWRGVVANVAGAAVSALVQAYQSRPDALIAGIGPAISRDHYRVGPEVLADVEGALGSLGGLIGSLDAEGGATLDVSEAVRRQLVRAGLRPECVERVPVCTYADTRFFSSRRARGAEFGSQGGVIGLIE